MLKVVRVIAEAAGGRQCADYDIFALGEVQGLRLKHLAQHKREQKHRNMEPENHLAE